MKSLKTKVSITLDSEIIETIRTLAEQDDRSFSQYINLVLREHLIQKQTYTQNKIGRDHTMKTLKQKVSITLDAEIIEAVKELAEQDDRSFSQYINMVLKEHLTKIKNKKNKILKYSDSTS